MPVDPCLLRAALDQMPECVAISDRTGRIRYANLATERLFGRSFAEMSGACLWDLFPEAIGSPFHAAFQRMSLEEGTTRGPEEVSGCSCPPFDRQLTVRLTRVGEQIHVSARPRIEDLRPPIAQEQSVGGSSSSDTQRLQSLLAVTGKLAGSDTSDQIARVAVDEGIRALDATTVGLWLISEDGAELVLRRERGFLPHQVAILARVRLDAPFPIVECVTTGSPIWAESRTDYVARYPELERMIRSSSRSPLSFAVVPLTIEGRAVGCMSFTFDDERHLTHEERTYTQVLASHTAEALRRARLYAELRDASETREAMIQASPAAILLVDDQGAIHAWNPAAERILGWTAEEAIGLSLPEATGADREEFLANIRHILAGQVIGGREVKRIRKSGERFDAQLYAAPIRLSDGRTLCLSILADISERKRIERGRALIAEASAILSRSLDREQTLCCFVGIFQDFADLCLVDLVGEDGELYRVAASHEPALRRLGPDRSASGRLPRILRDLDDTVLARLAADEVHLSQLSGLGVRSVLSVPLSGKGNELGMLGFVSRTRDFDEVDLDIARELGRHLVGALENARLYQEARAARRDAEAASQAKDQFLALLGHELRNPLAPISTALDLMKLRSPEHLERERAVVERQVGHLIRLVDDLLDVSRIARGKVELRRERVPLAGVVAGAIELTSPLLEQRHHQVYVEVPPELAVQGDRIRLTQVFANLLSNAARYTESGGRIEIRGRRREEGVVLTVRDDGIGIAPEMLRSIFDLFVQAPQSNARPDGGLGLGLSIVQSLVELHGGRVSAHSDGLGSGTEIVVILPAASSESPAPAPPQLVLPRSAVARRILVVDDNPDAAVLLGEVLDAQGHQTRTAFDGPSALRISEEFRPEIAVLDIGLPVMDGYELAQRLRESSRLPSLRLIALTGYGQDADRLRADRAGFEAHLTKPVPFERLVRLVADGGDDPGLRRSSGIGGSPPAPTGGDVGIFR